MSQYLGVEELQWRQQFVSDVFHALSQPLTALHCSLEIALKRPVDAQEQRGALQDALIMATAAIESAKFVRLLAEAEDPGDAIPVLLARIVREVCDELAPVAESKGVSIASSSDSEVIVYADERRLREALFLLTESALDRGGNLMIELHARHGFAVLRIGTVASDSIPTSRYRLSGVGKPILLAKKMIQAIRGELLEQSSKEGFSWVVKVPTTDVLGL